MNSGEIINSGIGQPTRARLAWLPRYLLVIIAVCAAVAMQGKVPAQQPWYSQVLLLCTVAISGSLGGIAPALLTAGILVGNGYRIIRIEGGAAELRSIGIDATLLAMLALWIAWLVISRRSAYRARADAMEDMERAVLTRTCELAAANEKLQIETDTLRRVIQHTRCILYEAQIDGLPGWEQDVEGLENRYKTDVSVPDEFAAQSVLPLDIADGKGYWHAWKSSRVLQDLPEMTRARARALVRGDRQYTLEFRCADVAGQIRWLREDVAIEPVSPGKWRAFGVVTDVTQSKRIEAALRESEQRFSLFMDNLPGPAFMKDRAGRLIYLNLAAKENLLSRWRDKWYGTTARDLFPPEVAEVLETHDRMVTSTGAPIHALEKIPGDDAVHNYLTTKFTYRGGDDEPVIAGVSIDVTEQLRAEAAVLRQKALLETLINAAPAGILMVSPSGEWMLHNERFVDLWPLPRTLVDAKDYPGIRRHVASLVKNGNQLLDQFAQLALDPESKRVEPLAMNDGRTLIRTSVPVHGEDGVHIGRFVFLQDVTEQERDKRRLRLLARELGRAGQRERRRVATLLHDDVGQMLTVVLMRIDSLRRECAAERSPDFDAIVDLLQQVVETARSMSVQLSPPVLHEFGLPRAIEWLGSHLLEPQGISLNFELESGLTVSDESALTLFQSVRESFINILKHASATNVIVRVSEAAGVVHVFVEDNGIGFNAVQWAREPSSGNHFGLFNGREQLDGLGGGLEVESEVNRFTRVHLWAPCRKLSIDRDTGDEDANSFGG